MADKEKVSPDFELAPLRPLDDFILESARFQIPNLQNFDKWGNRIVHNLLYYQSNYFVLMIILFSLVAMLHPKEMFFGYLVLLMLCAFAKFVSNNGSGIVQRKPITFSVVVILGLYLFTSFFDCFLVLLFGILLPVSAVFLHASLRLRNIKNKIINKMETIGFQKRTPMSIFLKELGIEESIL